MTKGLRYYMTEKWTDEEVLRYLQKGIFYNARYSNGRNVTAWRNPSIVYETLYKRDGSKYWRWGGSTARVSPRLDKLIELARL